MSIHRLFQCGLKSPKYSNHRQKAIPYIAVFQSLRSLRTATPSGPTPPGTAAYFNPRGPCGPRPDSFTALSLHQSYFNPRGPCGPRPYCLCWRDVLDAISILAVLADRDRPAPLLYCIQTSFNPRGPCGPRQFHHGLAVHLNEFQSSRSLRTATPEATEDKRTHCVSILAVLADRD